MCGPKQEQVCWLGRYARLTRRLAETVAHWCTKLPIRHVDALFGLHWDTVRLLERRRLAQQLGALPEPAPRRLVMDEFALYKGHRYATVVMDGDTRRVLWVGEGRSWEAIRPFFSWLGPARCARIDAVAMDMHTALDLEVKAHCSRVRWPMHTGKLEGINNRIKLMRRMAYGYRGSECFFLKIKAAFPGNP